MTLAGVAFVPSLEFNLFALHAVQAKQLMTPGAAGVHAMGGRLLFRLVFQRCVSKLFKNQPQTYTSSDVPIATAEVKPGRVVSLASIDINKMHVCDGQSYCAKLCEIPRKLDVTLKGGRCHARAVQCQSKLGGRCRGRLPLVFVAPITACIRGGPVGNEGH